MESKEEIELLDKYFTTFGSSVPLSTWDLLNYEHSFNSFGDCNICGAVVHIDSLLTHAKWHEEVSKILDHFKNYK